MGNTTSLCLGGWTAARHHSKCRSGQGLSNTSRVDGSEYASDVEACSPSQSTIPSIRNSSESQPEATDSSGVSGASPATILHTSGAGGLPHEHAQGAPRVACERLRRQTVEALQLAPSPQVDYNTKDLEITSILKLVMSIYSAPCAVLAICHVDVYLLDYECTFPWQRWYTHRAAWCPWTLLNNTDATTLIPDTAKDARVADSPYIHGPNGIRTYCAAPLIAMNGHRLGTLCFMDTKPRQFDAASCMILNNLAEMVVRHLEKAAMLKMRQEQGRQLEQLFMHLKRTVECLDQCLVFLETNEAGDCKIQYANQEWERLTGVERQRILGQSVAEVMCKTGGRPLPSLSVLNTRQAGEFCMTDVVLRGGAQRRYKLTFRPATRERIDNFAVPVGVPNYVPRISVPEGLSNPQRYCFMIVSPQDTALLPPVPHRDSAEEFTGWLGNDDDLEEVGGLQGLQIGQLLGQGAYGRVMSGFWNGAQVAVKFIDQAVPSMETLDGPASLEASLSQQLAHPNLVQTLAYDIQQIPATTTSLSSPYPSDSAHMPGRSPAGHRMSGPEDSGQDVAGHSGQEVPGQTVAGCGLQGHLPNERSTSGQQLSGALAADELAISIPSRQSDEAPGFGSHADQSSSFEQGNVIPAPATDASRPGLVAPDFPQAGASQGVRYRTRIVMEYCDKGTLQDAVAWGWFRTQPSHTTGAPNLPIILTTAREVAAALSFLHAHDVVHGDLSAANVLLTSSGADDRGYVSKVADFGLARILDRNRQILTTHYGTVTHMPPEALLHGLVSKATDVFSFGVLLWQMYTGSRPWAGLTVPEIVQAAQLGRRLEFHPGSWTPLVRLAEFCMRLQPTDRPSFERICACLDDLMVLASRGVGDGRG